MVPGSTLRYGSHFCRVTLKPRLSRRQPIEEAATPFPSEETTPPVTKIYFGAIRAARVPCRACLPSTGLTYIQLCSELVSLSNRTLGGLKTIFFLSPAAKPFRAKRVYSNWGYSPLPFGFSKVLQDRKLQPVHTNRGRSCVI